MKQIIREYLPKYVFSILMVCVCNSAAFAEKSKEINKHIAVNSSQKIEISNFPSAKITVKAWDKQEIYIAVKVKISASDEEYETQFIDSIKIQENITASLVIVSLKDNAPEENDNQFNFFGLKFGSYFKKDFTVEIFVPALNALMTNARYSSLLIDGIRGELRASGKSNTLTVSDCFQLKEITNDYGAIKINGCKGNKVNLSTRNGSLAINDFDGAVEINAPYSSIKIINLRLGAFVKSKSATIEISDVGGDVTVESNYSSISITEVKGRMWVSSKSGVVSIKKCGSATVNADYSTIDLKEMHGDSISISAYTKSGIVRIDEAIGKVDIDAPQSKIALRKVSGEIAITTQSGKISITEVNGKANIKADYSTIISRSTEVHSLWLNGKGNSIEINCSRLPKNTVILNEQGTTSVNIPTGFSGLLNLEAQENRIETNLQLPASAKGATVFRGEIGTGNETITIKSGKVRLYQI
ncbi:MAG: hypothetical protein HYZ54_08920 [Ignavibacteriae bacterium]|nr:hypothetical protein [Ignavibacteriota bacterium]